MSGHETIRVLEVEVDTSLTSSSSEGKAAVDGEDGGRLNSEGGAQNTPTGKIKTAEGEPLSVPWFPFNLFHPLQTNQMYIRISKLVCFSDVSNLNN